MTEDKGQRTDFRLPSSESHFSGFLLLEVMVSVLLVTGGLLIVTASFSVSKKMLVESRELFYSTLLLREKMFEFEEKGQMDGTSLSGSFQDEAIAWSVQTVSIPDTDLEELTVEVFYKRKPSNINEIRTYLKRKKE